MTTNCTWDSTRQPRQDVSRPAPIRLGGGEAQGYMAGEANELRPFTNAAISNDSETAGAFIGELEVGVDETALAADPADEVGRVGGYAGGVDMVAGGKAEKGAEVGGRWEGVEVVPCGRHEHGL